jgi:hypothetical protein
MSNASDPDNDLLERVEEKPVMGPKAKVMFMPPAVPAGGRAAGKRSKDKPPGSRFNRPTEEDEAYYEQTAAERNAAIDNDPVVRSSKGKDSLALLSTLKGEVAREAATLAYQRTINTKMGKDITTISARRIDALKKIADIEMEMRKIGFDQVDVHSEKFQRIFALWVTTIREVAEETLEPESLDLFFNRLTSAMDGWEDRAEELVR